MSAFSPLFIVGYPRSGTTLLLHILRTLDIFPDYEFDETHYFSHHYLRYGRLNREANQQKLFNAVTDSNWFKSSGLDREEFISTVKNEKLTYPVVLKSFMELIAAKQGKTRWLEKTPWHILYVPEIAKSFPDAKFIFIVRDPRSVVQSVCKAGWRKGGLREWRVAVSWFWHNAHVEKKLNMIPDRFIHIRYEDLILTPENVEKKISRFLGVEINVNSISPDKLKKLAKNNSSYEDEIVGLSEIPLCRWKKNMDPKTMAAIEYIVGKKFMRKYNYEPFASMTPSLYSKFILRLYLLFYFCLKSARLLAFPLVRR